MIHVPLKKKSGHAVNLLFANLFCLRDCLLTWRLQEGGSPPPYCLWCSLTTALNKELHCQRKAANNGRKPNRNYRMKWFGRRCVGRTNQSRLLSGIDTRLRVWKRRPDWSVYRRRMFQLDRRLGQPCCVQSIIQVIQQTFTCIIWHVTLKWSSYGFFFVFFREGSCLPVFKELRSSILQWLLKVEIWKFTAASPGWPALRAFRQ